MNEQELKDIHLHDEVLTALKLIEIGFGKYARCYNLVVVTSAAKQSIGVKTIWEDYESSILTSNPELLKKFVIDTLNRWLGKR